MSRKPILCLDFDGVIHSYTSGWKGADVIPDPPVDGAMQFIVDALTHFDVHVFSSRSGQRGGIPAMQDYIYNHLIPVLAPLYDSKALAEERAYIKSHKSIKWPTEKPPAMVTIDDRAITFDGTWPDINTLLEFKPWNHPNKPQER